MDELYSDDGLLMGDELGEWSLEKLRIIDCYLNIFSSAMKQKWSDLCYVDLYASAGKSKVKGSDEIVPCSSLRALAVKFPFTHYFYCDIESEKLSALKQRVDLLFPELVERCHFECGDCNQKAAQILQMIPEKDSLTFCLLDVYGLQNLVFETIAQFAQRRTDFLILIPLQMDFSRNREKYPEFTNRFLGVEDWTGGETIVEPAAVRKRFMDVLYSQMEKIGYKSTRDEVMPIKNTKGVTIYELAFFSKHPLGKDFFKKCKKGPQRFRQDQLL